MAQIERTALEVLLQQPLLVPDDVAALGPETFSVPAYRAVHEAILAAGGLGRARALGPDGDATAWVGAVLEEAVATLRPLVTELAVAPLPQDRPESLPDYVRGVSHRLLEVGLTRQIADLRGALQRMDPADQGYQDVFARLLSLEARRRAVRESA